MSVVIIIAIRKFTALIVWVSWVATLPGDAWRDDSLCNIHRALYTRTCDPPQFIPGYADRRDYTYPESIRFIIRFNFTSSTLYRYPSGGNTFHDSSFFCSFLTRILSSVYRYQLSRGEACEYKPFCFTNLGGVVKYFDVKNLLWKIPNRRSRFFHLGMRTWSVSLEHADFITRFWLK